MAPVKLFFDMLLLQTATSPLQEFIWKHFQDKTVVVVSSNFENWDPRLFFIYSLGQPKLLVRPEARHDLKIFDDYIIAESNLTVLRSSLHRLKYKINTRGRFVVINQRNEDDLRSVLETLWHFYIYNVAVYSNWTSFVTWYPYRTRGNVTDLVTTPKSLDPFANKIPKIVEGCRANVTWNYQSLSITTPFDKSNPGYSVRLLDAATAAINLTPVYLTANLNYMELARTKGAYHDLRADMLRRRIELAFVTGRYREPIGPEFEVTSSYYYTDCYFVLPPRRTSRTNILAIFSVEIWATIAVSLVCMAVVWRRLDRSSFQIVRLVFQGEVTPPLPETAPQRLVCLLFFFYVTNLQWIYVSQLSGVLSKPGYEPKISTMVDLARSDKKLKFVGAYNNYLMYRGDGVYESLMKKRIEETKIASFEAGLKEFVRKLDHGIVITDHRMFLVKDHQKLQVVSHDKITTLQSFLVVRKGFPLFDRLNAAILRITESGLMSRWIYESQVGIDKMSMSNVETHKSRSIDLQRVFSAVVILALGLSASGLAFVAEVLWKWLHKKINE